VGIVFLEYRHDKGVERISAEIADRVAAQGHTVDYFCARWSQNKTSQVRFRKIPALGGPHSLRYLSFALIARMQMSRGDYDITHSYGNVVGCDVITAQSCHRAGMDAARRYMPMSVGRNRNFGIVDRIQLALEHENYFKRKYKRIIAASTSVKRELMQYYNVPEDDISVIANGVDIDEFNPEKREKHRSEMRERLGIPPESVVTIFVAHEFARKGLDALLRALAVLKDENVFLVVCGDDRSKPYVQLARAAGVGDQVRFAGAQERMSMYYAAADVFVFPTHYEPFGLVIIEAMASGLPVIVSSRAGVAQDIIVDGKDGFILSDPGSEAEIASKMRKLVDDPVLREKIGRRAREKAQGYTWERCAGSVLKLYEEIIALSSRRGRTSI
jgi:UDP-glucose:(heptosyl)LPS alpha-1,3-glucosyltransferase